MKTYWDLSEYERSQLTDAEFERYIAIARMQSDIRVDEPEPWKVRITHYPPGNPENAQEITISYSAWPAHQAHGDVILEYIYR